MLRPNWTIVSLVALSIIVVQAIIYYSILVRQGNCPKCQSGDYKEQQTAQSRFQIDPSAERAKAAFVILVRNSELEGLKKTIPMLEKRFNARFGYPYVLLNDMPFEEEFKREVMLLTSSQVTFGTVPHEHWSYPEWINVTKADECRADMEARDIIYGGSLSYRHMCRFNSGFFFRHPLLREYDYYWRVEPSVEFLCDVEYDPFLYMKKQDKAYGFVIMLHEFTETIPTLWETTKAFMKDNPRAVNPKNSLQLLQRDDGSYNGCHFWSNFEIASLKFLRSPEYLSYFDYLDKAGGFFYERWGDAPVHSIAAAMLLPIEKIHYFEDIGYYHGPFYNCPANPALQLRCSCDPKQNVNYDHECYNIYHRMMKR